MKSNIITKLSLSLNDKVDVVLSTRNAFTLALFCSKAAWPESGQLAYFLSLDKPTVFSDGDEEYPEQSVHSCRVVAYIAPDHDKLSFEFGPGENQRIVVERKELLNLLNSYLGFISGGNIRIPTVERSEEPDEIKGPEGFSSDSRKYFITNPDSEHGAIAIECARYVKLVSRKPDSSVWLPLCDTEIFYGNQSVPRTKRYTDIALNSKTFTGGMNGKAIKENIVFHFSNYDLALEE